MIRVSTRLTLTTAALSLSLAVVALSPARAADDDVPLDTKILRGILEGIGLERDGAGITYQERAPLVIPPSRTLPPPQNDNTAIAKNPAWPKDPDVQRAKEEAAVARTQSPFASDQILKDQSVLRGNDLTPGPKPRRSARAGSSAGGSTDSDDSRLSPSQLGYKGGLFGKIFGGGDEPESARFTGEPPRAALTEPPRGYQTPSPDQPYGVGKEASKPQVKDYQTTHVEGER